jgi:hypothetical protein
VTDYSLRNRVIFFSYFGVFVKYSVSPFSMNSRIFIFFNIISVNYAMIIIKHFHFEIFDFSIDFKFFLYKSHISVVYIKSLSESSSSRLSLTISSPIITIIINDSIFTMSTSHFLEGILISLVY